MQKIIPSSKYLGRLCNQKHNYNNTGKSLRWKSNYNCCICVRLRWKETKKSEKHKLTANIYQKKYRLTESGKKHMAKSTINCKNRRKKLGNQYVTYLLFRNSNLLAKDIPPELVIAKREVLKLHRLIRKVG